MHADGGERAGLFADGFGVGQRDLNRGVAGRDAARMRGYSERNQVVLKGGDAVEPPGGIGEGSTMVWPVSPWRRAFKQERFLPFRFEGRWNGAHWRGYVRLLCFS